MPIVINEFEVLVEPPARAPEPGPTQADQEARPAELRPEDIVRIQRCERQRRARLRAE
jgi:hypothetical protein